MTLCAKWDAINQKPYDIIPVEDYRISNGNGIAPSEWSTRNAHGVYEYIPIELAAGEGLDGVYWIKAENVIYQRGDVASAADMQARADADALVQATQAQIDRHNKVLAMCDAYGQRVAILEKLLDAFGMHLPIEPDAAYQQIEDGIAAGLLTNEQLVMVPLLRDSYDRCREVMTDDDIAAVWSIVGGKQ